MRGGTLRMATGSVTENENTRRKLTAAVLCSLYPMSFLSRLELVRLFECGDAGLAAWRGGETSSIGVRITALLAATTRVCM